MATLPVHREEGRRVCSVAARCRAKDMSSSRTRIETDGGALPRHRTLHRGHLKLPQPSNILTASQDHSTAACSFTGTVQ